MCESSVYWITGILKMSLTYVTTPKTSLHLTWFGVEKVNACSFLHVCVLFIWIDVIETVNLVYSYLKTIWSYRTDPFCIAFALWVWACLCTSFSMMCCSINDSLVQVGRSIANPRAFLHSLIPHGAVSPTVQYFISYSCSSSIVSRLNSLMNN